MNCHHIAKCATPSLSYSTLLLFSLYRSISPILLYNKQVTLHVSWIDLYLLLTSVILLHLLTFSR